MHLIHFFSTLLGGIDDPLLVILEDSCPDSHDAFQCLWIVYVINEVCLICELLE